ncbi:substrate-binding domain-containing protein [Rhodococcus kronopolitis]
MKSPAVRRGAAAVLVLVVMAAGWAIVDRQRDGGASGPRIALSLSTLNNPFFVDVRDGAQAEADRLGARLTVTDAGSDPSRQANDLQNAIAQRVDAIVVNPVDSDAIVPSVKAANAANIPVVALDRGPSGGAVVTTVASDNVEGGRLAAQQLAELVGAGPVAVLEGKPGTSAARDRQAGFDEEIVKYPSITVVASQPADFDRTKALNVMSNLMQSNPDIRGVFAANDEMALGAIKALGSRAGNQVKIVGFDGTPDGLAAVEAGTQNADIAQQPRELGAVAVRLAVESLGSAPAGEPGTDGVDSGVHSVPVRVVTRGN